MFEAASGHSVAGEADFVKETTSRLTVPTSNEGSKINDWRTGNRQVSKPKVFSTKSLRTD
jgi:hypothetical protein